MNNYNNDSPSSTSVSGLRSFVSESQLEERRKQRQSEWEKVRKHDDPFDAPEEQYDHRTLFDRLKEQKDKKQEEYEESKKLKHLIKGLDNDEVSFLEMVDNTKMEMESQRWAEEMKEIDEYKKAVAHLTHEEQEKRLNDFKSEMFSRKCKKSDIYDNKSGRKSQSALLANVIRKRTHSEGDDKTNNKKTKDNDDASKAKDVDSNELSSSKEKDPDSNELSSSNVSQNTFPTIKCIGVLPGLGQYISDSSDSEDSSNSEENNEIKDFNLLVRGVRNQPHDTKGQNGPKNNA